MPLYTDSVIRCFACSATLPLYSAVSTVDNCGTPTVTQTPLAGTTVSGVGTTTVTLSANDGNGNIATCSFNVDRVDNTPPTVTCPATQTLTLGAVCTATLPAYSATGSSDNCGIPTVTQSPAAGTTVSGVGTTTVTLTANDGNGNIATCSFSVDRVDNTPPTVTCPATQTLTLGAACTATLPAYSATATADNCGTPTVTQSPASGTTVTGVGTTTVVLTANDGNGNIATCSFSVNRVDLTPATITCPTTQTLTLGAACTATLPAYSAVSTADNCGTPTVTQSPASGTIVSGVGATTVTLTANDGNGNSPASCSFTVNRVDTTPPTITCPANITQLSSPTTCNAVVSWVTPATADNCAVASVTPSIPSGSTFSGTTTVNYTVIDASGNSAGCSFTVTINDGQPPVLSPCPANIVNCNNTITWTPPTATDNCITVNVTGTHNPGTAFPLGTTTVTYTATDGANNTATCSFTVTVSLLTASLTASNYNGYNISCFGGNNGSITATPSGGILPYSYVWSNGQTGSNMATGLTAGFYSVTISDPSGCTVVQTITLTQPQTLNCTATVVNPTCFGSNNGSITTNASGGVAPYNYAWSGTGGPFGNVSSINELDGGTYTVTVTDANGCVCINTFTVVEPPEITPLAGTVNIFEGAGIIPTFYNVNIITFSGGLAPYNYVWNNTGYVVYNIPSPGTINIIYADNATWNVTITDSNGCGVGLLEFSSTSGNTNPAGLLNIINSTITPDFGLSNGTISLNVGGGTPCAGGVYQYQWSGPSTWTGAPGATSNSLTNLPFGWYVVTITDCSSTPQSTVGWFWVPKQTRGRGKSEFTNDLIQVAPNPFALETTISFSWPKDDDLSLKVYDVAGREVMKLFTGTVKADQLYDIEFDGRALPNGLYICRLVNAEGISIQTKTLHLQSK
ncbi:MAG: HYR domain-containing protein [Sphingobacteriales bacterium]|nr:MAG: HYR domain-containing protein [Sphingobacteriales bacterium]